MIATVKGLVYSLVVIGLVCLTINTLTNFFAAHIDLSACLRTEYKG